MRLCVTGGRDYANKEHVYAVLDKLHAEQPITLLLHGMATGADMLATHWARNNEVPMRGFQAEWKRLGRVAGPARNRTMLRDGNPDLVLAFPSVGTGTDNCVIQARGLGIPVMIAPAPEPEPT